MIVCDQERTAMRHVTLLFVLLNLIGFSACGGGTGTSGNTDPGSPPPTIRVSGTVTFKGAPLAGATVTNFLTNTNTVFKTTTTDANGNYTFTGMSAGWTVPADYQVYVNKPGYAFYPGVGSGATVQRFDYTGQYLGNGVAPSGLFFNVIDVVALPDGSVSGANFAAYDGSNPPITLAATGQLVSYAAGDDASLHKGIAWSGATRFTDNQDGTVSDSLTGLVWMKDAGCPGTANWADALTTVHALADGACGLKDGSAAGTWRLPNINELESLIDASAANAALSSGHPFQNVPLGIYWSSTSYYSGVGGSDKAWTIRLADGRYMNDTSANVKATAMNQVWAVKGTGASASVKLRATGFYVSYAAGDDGSIQSGVPLTAPRFIDNNNGTLTDTMTGLVWLKKADCIHGTWSDDLVTVSTLASGQCGLSDNSVAGQWRMPNRNELESLSDRAQTNLAAYFDYTYFNKNGTVFQAPIFSNYIETQYYWTSTTNAADPSEAWTVYSCDFGVYDVSKSSLGYTIAVR